MSKIQSQCQCSDPMCPVCSGKCAQVATQMLCRVDMSDAYDLPMCDGCADDALESGVFDTKTLEDQRDDAPENDDSFDAEREAESTIGDIGERG